MVFASEEYRNLIKYEISDKSQGIAYGGIGLMHRLADEFGLTSTSTARW